MSEQAFERTKQLIQEKRYREARGLLNMMSHLPKAQRWIAEIDKIMAKPTVVAHSPQPKIKETPERMNEIRDFHPLVAVWLAQHGYQFEHEVRLKGGVRVDYLAKHMTTKQILTVECKVNLNRFDDFRKALVQATDYQIRLGGTADAALAIPKNELRETWIELAATRDVQLILIDTSSITVYEQTEPDLQPEPELEPVMENRSILPDSVVRGYRTTHLPPAPYRTMPISLDPPKMSFFHRYGFWLGVNFPMTLFILLAILASPTNEMFISILAGLCGASIVNVAAIVTLFLIRHSTGFLKP